MINFLIIEAELEKIGTLKDGSININFHTQELSPEKGGQLLAIRKKLVYLAIKTENFNEGEKLIISELEAEINEVGKTPSKRLRNVLFRTWEQNPEGYKDFNLFYIAKMESIINHLKGKLEP